MADRLYLSLWLKNSSPLTLTRRYFKILDQFPFSKLAPTLLLTVRAVSNREAPLVEDSFADSSALDKVRSAVDAWSVTDACFEIEAAWDLLQPQEGDWKLQPSKVMLMAYGPEFEHEKGEDLRIEFGNEALFLPESEAPASFRFVEANIRSLLRLVKELETAIPVEKRLLWSESGDNFAERLSAMTHS